MWWFVLLHLLYAVTVSRSQLQDVYSWRTLTFADPSSPGGFRQVENAAIMGVEAWQSRLFFTSARWKEGVPYSLTTLPQTPEPGMTSPPLQPYPSADWHQLGDCNNITTVNRVRVDICHRLWVVDGGVINDLGTREQVCPPQLLVFDLRSDRLLRRYRFPESQYHEASLLAFPVVDIRDGRCDEAFAYISDDSGNGLLVYDWRQDRSWRAVEHPSMRADPDATNFTSNGITISTADGAQGVALTPLRFDTERQLFFHSMASFRFSYVSTSVLRSEQDATTNTEAYQQTPAISSQVIGITTNDGGTLFFGLINSNSVACMTTRPPFQSHLLFRDDDRLIWPNDVLIDIHQTLWVLSNRLANYVTDSINFNETNFRILRADARRVARGTVCESRGFPTYTIGSYGNNNPFVRPSYW